MRYIFPMRVAACMCGKLTARCSGEPVRVSVCHCLSCQRRTGGAFSVQARFPSYAVNLEGDRQTFAQRGDSGRMLTCWFCPDCGVTVTYVAEAEPDLIAVPLGLFGEAAFPPPAYSTYEERKRSWVQIVGTGIDHYE